MNDGMNEKMSEKSMNHDKYWDDISDEDREDVAPENQKRKRGR